jgi:hypothetical protein
VQFGDTRGKHPPQLNFIQETHGHILWLTDSAGVTSSIFLSVPSTPSLQGNSPMPFDPLARVFTSPILHDKRRDASLDTFEALERVAEEISTAEEKLGSFFAGLEDMMLAHFRSVVRAIEDSVAAVRDKVSSLTVVRSQKEQIDQLLECNACAQQELETLRQEYNALENRQNEMSLQTTRDCSGRKLSGGSLGRASSAHEHFTFPKHLPREQLTRQEHLHESPQTRLLELTALLQSRDDEILHLTSFIHALETRIAEAEHRLYHDLHDTLGPNRAATETRVHSDDAVEEIKAAHAREIARLEDQCRALELMISSSSRRAEAAEQRCSELEQCMTDAAEQPRAPLADACAATETRVHSDDAVEEIKAAHAREIARLEDQCRALELMISSSSRRTGADELLGAVDASPLFVDVEMSSSATKRSALELLASRDENCELMSAKCGDGLLCGSVSTVGIESLSSDAYVVKLSTELQLWRSKYEGEIKRCALKESAVVNDLVEQVAMLEAQLRALALDESRSKKLLIEENDAKIVELQRRFEEEKAEFSERHEREIQQLMRGRCTSPVAMRVPRRDGASYDVVECESGGPESESRRTKFNEDSPQECCAATTYRIGHQGKWHAVDDEHAKRPLDAFEAENVVLKKEISILRHHITKLLGNESRLLRRLSDGERGIAASENAGAGGPQLSLSKQTHSAHPHLGHPHSHSEHDPSNAHHKASCIWCSGRVNHFMGGSFGRRPKTSQAARLNRDEDPGWAHGRRPLEQRLTRLEYAVQVATNHKVKEALVEEILAIHRDSY